MNKQMIELAASIWVELLRKPKMDAGDDTLNATLKVALNDFGRSKGPTEEQLAAFKAKLIELMENEKDAYMADILAVDYWPEGLLYDADQAVKLPFMSFPVKTVMKIEEDHIMLGRGYAASFERIEKIEDLKL